MKLYGQLYPYLDYNILYEYVIELIYLGIYDVIPLPS